MHLHPHLGLLHRLQVIPPHVLELFLIRLAVEVHYVGSVGHGVQWDTVTEYHAVPVHQLNITIHRQHVWPVTEYHHTPVHVQVHYDILSEGVYYLFLSK